MKDYRIYFEGINDLEEGWSCGSGKRTHSAYYRTDNINDADIFDKRTAILFSYNFNKYGYKNKISPKISKKQRLKILENR